MREITGIMVYYYAVCKRKLWYFYNSIEMEQNSEEVFIGKVIDESSYNREEKHINIDNVINIDFIKKQGIIHEIKKSRKIEYASILQVKYYLYYLWQRGIENITGKIDYPLLKESVEVKLAENDIKDLENILSDLVSIVEMDIPPERCDKRICNKCAYYELCYI